jgi:hypothetical protein
MTLTRVAHTQHHSSFRIIWFCDSATKRSGSGALSDWGTIGYIREYKYLKEAEAARYSTVSYGTNIQDAGSSPQRLGDNR